MVSLNREQVARASRASVGDLRPLCKMNCLLLPWRLSRWGKKEFHCLIVGISGYRPWWGF